jgi:glycosyltransferase involved in cell wall biosynthesis
VKLLIVSHKETWPMKDSPSGHRTVGGFPHQIRALSEMFDETALMVPVFGTSPPAGAVPLQGERLNVLPLPAPKGNDARRKLSMLAWIPRNLPSMWRSIGKADAVHALVPGDVGMIGMFIALARRKRLFVRHCGTWGNRATAADRLLHRTLLRAAGKRALVLATGGDATPPAPENAAVRWIFSVSLSTADMDALPGAAAWTPGTPLRMVTVGRISEGKNALACIEAMKVIRRVHPDATLSVIGEGPLLQALRDKAAASGLDGVVIFHGNLPHARVMQELGQAHLFLFPTRVKEGFPKALLEAMACGLPAIATRVSVIPYLLRGDAGIVLDEPDAEHVARAVLELTAQPDRIAAMSRRARERSREYTTEKWQEILGALLRREWRVNSLRSEK